MFIYLIQNLKKGLVFILPQIHFAFQVTNNSVGQLSFQGSLMSHQTSHFHEWGYAPLTILMLSDNQNMLILTMNSAAQLFINHTLRKLSAPGGQKLLHFWAIPYAACFTMSQDVFEQVKIIQINSFALKIYFAENFDVWKPHTTISGRGL